MDRIWLLYGYYRYSPLRCLLKAWNHVPSDEDQNEVKRIGGFDGYELEEMELITKETK